MRNFLLKNVFWVPDTSLKKIELKNNWLKRPDVSNGSFINLICWHCLQLQLFAGMWFHVHYQLGGMLCNWSLNWQNCAMSLNNALKLKKYRAYQVFSPIILEVLFSSSLYSTNICQDIVFCQISPALYHSWLQHSVVKYWCRCLLRRGVY